MTRTGLFVTMVLGGVVLGGSAAAGCSSDDAGGSSGSKDDGSGGSTGTNSTGQGSTSTGSSGECAGMVDMSDACETCAATMCTAQALACCEQQQEAEAMGKQGCLDIVDCGREKMCSGVDCLDADKCGPVITAVGVEVATEFAQPLGNCVTEKCSTCMGTGGAGGAGTGGAGGGG